MIPELKCLDGSRLPRSGAVAFTIRTYFHPICDVCRELYVPGRLANARSWAENVSSYAGKERYQDILLECPDRRRDEQIAAGLDLVEGNDVRTSPY